MPLRPDLLCQDCSHPVVDHLPEDIVEMDGDQIVIGKKGDCGHADCGCWRPEKKEENDDS